MLHCVKLLRFKANPVAGFGLDRAIEPKDKLPFGLGFATSLSKTHGFSFFRDLSVSIPY